MDVPFVVTVPVTAEPGGHYASILVGTQPANASIRGALMKISSYVSSLLMVKIKGNAIEKGRIREFRTNDVHYDAPDADFMLRFENTGNTHLKPQGNVTIFNMWGKERGRIDINQKGNFGNVLPKSIRKFEFSWHGEASAFDVGRYSAAVTLAFGQDSKQNVTATTYFWVIPTVPVLITLFVLALIVISITWMIRRYVRRALEIERVRAGIELPIPVASPETVQNVPPLVPPAPPVAMRTLMEPLKEGVIDLRRVSRASDVVVEQQVGLPTENRESISLGDFIRKYKLFFAFLLLVVASLLGGWLYLSRAMVPSRGFQITDVQVHEEVLPE